MSARGARGAREAREAVRTACARPLDAAACRRRAALAGVLAGWAEQGGDAAAAASLARLAEGVSPLLVAGQQAGLAGGAALSLWKALALLAAADRVEAAEGIRPLCVYWVEGNDHDWDEAARPGWPAAGPAPPPPGASGRAVGRTLLDEAWWRERAAALDPLLADWRDDEAAILRGTRGDTLAVHSARLLRRLLPGSGLLVLDPSLPALRALAAPFAALLQERGRELAGILAADSAALAAAGQPVPAPPGEGPPWFTEDGAGRRRRATWGEEVPAAAFSPDVLTRVLLQDWLLSPAASLLGPTEGAYHRQTEGAARLLGLAPVLRLPRPQVQLARAEDLAAWPSGADPWEPPQPGRPWPEALLAALPGGAELAARLARQTAAEAELLALCAGGRADLAGLARRQEALGTQLRQALVEAHKSGHRALLKDLHARAAWQDGPAGPQERRVNTLALLGRMGGRPLLASLRRELDSFAAGRQRFVCDPATGEAAAVAARQP